MAEPSVPVWRRELVVVVVLGGIGWLLAGVQGVIVVVPAAIVGRRNPRLILAYAAGVLVLAGAATLFEGSADQQSFGRFVLDRPIAATLGRVAGLLAVVGVVWSMVVERERSPVRHRGPSGGTDPDADAAIPGLVAVVRSRLQSEHGHVVTGSGLVMAAFLVQAATGLLFWVLAARRFDQAIVGVSAGLMASLQFINYLTAFGLPELLSRHHPLGRRPDGLFTWSVTATSVGSVIGCVVYPLVVSSPSTTVLTDHGAAGVAIFFACTAGAAIGMLADARLMAQRRWHLVLARLGGSGIIRLPLLFVGPGGLDPGLWLFVVSAGPLALSAVPAGIAALRGHGLTWSSADLGTTPNSAVRYASVNHVAHLAVFAPQFALPVVVLANVSSEANAVFYVAWNITAVIMVLPVTVGRVLLVEGSRALDQLWTTTRTALTISLSIAFAALVGCLAFRWLIPVVYGRDYREAADLVVPLVAGAVPWAVTAVALGAFRVMGDARRLLVTTGVLASTVLGWAWVGVPRTGISAAAAAWLVGNLVAAAVAGSLLVSRWRRRDSRIDATAAT